MPLSRFTSAAVKTCRKRHYSSVASIFIDGGRATSVIFACGKELLDILPEKMHVSKVLLCEISRSLRLSL